MEAPPPSKRLLQSKLQEAVQSVQWTYSLFWQICPQQGMLVWGDGYYNGAIKTRKTVQPMEVSPEEASLQRSQQLRELYESLSAGETNQPARRPCAALSPEDLTESEWFYLMCVSFSFPSGVGLKAPSLIIAVTVTVTLITQAWLGGSLKVCSHLSINGFQEYLIRRQGLPGKAYARQHHVWLTGANEVDSKTFSRAILAKSARIQTVVCVPLLDGVVELGTTERVLEDLALVQHIKSFFVFAGDSCAATTTDHLQYPNLPPKPALSEHSTSNPAMSSMDVDPPTVDGNNLVDEDAEEDEDEEEEEDDDEEGGEDQHERQSDSDQTVRNNNSRQAAAADYDEAGMVPAAAVAEPSELIMQLEMSEDIRLGSPDDVSNNLDTDFHLLAVGSSQGVASISVEADHDQQRRAESSQKWATMLEDPVLTSRNSLQPPPSGQIPLEEEDTHYSQTVSTVLHQKQPTGYVIYSAAAQSAFARWKNYHHHHHPLPIPLEGTSQWVLKYILFSVPHLHSKYRDENSPRSSSRGDHAGGGDVASRFRKGTPQEELSLSANHVLAERRRREKLNERFIILRSLVPFVTKMDKASILGDTIEYVKQLRKRIQDLEARNSLQIVEADNQRSRSGDQLHRTASCGSKLNQRITSSGQKGLDRARTGSGPGSEKKKLRIVEGSSGGGAMPVPAVATSVQVSIIESDALVELQCCTKEGLLLDVMQVLRELLIEVIAVQSSLNNGAFTAQLRAKVKDNADGKRASIVEVKRAINQIILQH